MPIFTHPAVQLQEVGRLHQHVVEFEKGQRLLVLDSRADEFEAQHLVDRKVHAIVAQEVNVAEPLQPVGIVDHDGLGRSGSEGQEGGEGRSDALEVGGDLRLAQQGALRRFVGWIADLGGASPHQHDWPVAGLLQAAQGHDLHQVADVQAGGRGVEADIGRDRRIEGRRVQALQISGLVDVAALHEGADEVRARFERV